MGVARATTLAHQGDLKTSCFHAAKAIAAVQTAHSLAGGIMSSHRNRGVSRAMALLCGISAAAVSSLAIAQTTPPVEDKNIIDEVVVTGSRIARPNLDSPVPVTTVTAEELFETGNTSVGDLLNDLPALRSTFSQSNSSRFLGTTGLNLLDLRGLGTQRTLVLVNGRRHVGGDILSNAISPDINTFPTDLVERIDIVTGGNSAVYGSDAIAGVVNFVLKKDFQGLQFRGQGGQSFESDGGNYYASILAGKNFMDDRGNIAMNLEYAKQEPFFASDRDNLAHQGLFVQDQSDPMGSNSDGIPDRGYYHDVRAVTFSSGGSLLFSPVQPMVGAFAPCGSGPNPRASDQLPTPYVCPYIFQSDGSLVAQTGTRVGFGPNGNFDGGNGSNNREAKLLGIYPTLDRVSFNVFGNLELSEAFAPFIEAKYVKTDSTRWGSPAFFQGSTIGAGIDLRERPRFDNPFLTDATRAQINAGRAVAGLAALPLDSTTRLTLFKNLEDLGGRQEDAERETTRIVLGVNGQISEAWNYEVAVNWGQFREDTLVFGNLNVQRFLLAMDAARNPAGAIVCRSQIDPAAAFGYSQLLDNDGIPNNEENEIYAQSLLAADVAACVPLNPFGTGNITQQMKDYLLTDTTSVGKIDQLVYSASLAGDTRQWFSLPAGPIGVAVGFEHREDEAFFEAEEIVARSLTFYNALPLFDPPKAKVDEVFTEFRIPLLKELPFAQELTLNVAGRYSDYGDAYGTTGGVIAYNGSLEWSPIESVRLRAGLARAVRAPNLSDLYSEQSQNFAQINDPCAANRFINSGTATRPANCLAAGIPANYDHVYQATPEILSGGNPELKEETSDSLTIGLVWQPNFMPGFNFSADYFDIDIDDVITAPTAQQIMDACYDAADISNQFCGLFQRYGAAGGPGFDPTQSAAATLVDPNAPYALINGTLQQTQLNYASSTARGIDFEVGYSHEVGSLGNLNTRLVYTRMLQIDDFIDPANPSRPDQVLYELGDPKNAFNWNTDLKTSKFQFGYQMRYIGRQVINFAEDVFEVGGRPPNNPDYAVKKYYHGLFYHDIRAAMDIKEDWNAYLGVDNVADRVPPLGLTGTGAGSGIYESRGRYWYAGVKVNF
jgi:outer membrane receptor protein involved in Fe transport